MPENDDIINSLYPGAKPPGPPPSSVPSGDLDLSAPDPAFPEPDRVPIGVPVAPAVAPQAEPVVEDIAVEAEQEFVPSQRPLPSSRDVLEAEQEVRNIDARTSSGGIDVEADPERASRRIESIQGKPRTVGGTSTFGRMFGTGATLPTQQSEGFFDVAPTEERQALNRMRSEAADAQTDSVFDRVLDPLRPQVLASSAQDVDFEAGRNRLRASILQVADDALASPERRLQLLEAAQSAPEDIRPLMVQAASVRAPEDRATLESSLDSRLAPGLVQRAGEGLAWAFTEEGPDGQLVESDTAYALRLIGSGVSGLAGLVDGLILSGIQGSPVTTTVDSVERAVRDGEGFVDVFGRLGNQAGDAVDAYLGTESGEKAGQVLGGLAGLAVDFALPIDGFAGKLLGTLVKGTSKARASSALTEVHRLISQSPEVDLDAVRRAVDSGTDISEFAAEVAAKSVDDLADTTEVRLLTELADIGDDFSASLDSLIAQRAQSGDLDSLFQGLVPVGPDGKPAKLLTKEGERATELTGRLLNEPDFPATVYENLDKQGVPLPAIAPIARRMFPDDEGMVSLAVEMPDSVPGVLARFEALRDKVTDISERTGILTQRPTERDVARAIVSDRLTSAMTNRATASVPGLNVPLTSLWTRVTDNVRVPNSRVDQWAAKMDELVTTPMRDALTGPGPFVLDEATLEPWRKMAMKGDFRLTRDQRSRLGLFGEEGPATWGPAERRLFYDAVGEVAAREVPGATAVAPVARRIADLRRTGGSFLSRMRDRTLAENLERTTFRPEVFDRFTASAATRALADQTRLFSGNESAISNPLLRELVREVRNRAGSATDVFRTRWSAARAQGLTPEDATVQAVLDDFSSPTQLATDYLTAVFGGLEQTADVLSGAATGPQLGLNIATINRGIRELATMDEGLARLVDIPADSTPGFVKYKLREHHADLPVRELVTDYKASMAALRRIMPEAEARQLMDLRPKYGLENQSMGQRIRSTLLRTDLDPADVPDVLLSAVYNQRRNVETLTEVVDRWRRVLPKELLTGRGIIEDVSDTAVVEAIGLAVQSGAVGSAVASVLADGRATRAVGRVVLDRLPEWLAGGQVRKVTARELRGEYGGFGQDAKAVADELTGVLQDPELANSVMARIAVRTSAQVMDPELRNALVRAAVDKTTTEGHVVAAMNNLVNKLNLESRVEALGPVDVLVATPGTAPTQALMQDLALALRPDSTLADLTQLTTGRVGQQVDEFGNLVRQSALTPSLSAVARYAGNSFLNGWNTLERMAKGGLLGGQVLPNMPYHVTNFVSAPAIILQTLGTKEALRALSDVARRPLQAGAEIFGTANMSEVLVRRAGRSWTRGDLLRLASENGVTRSQAAAESAAGLADTVAQLQRGTFARNFDPTKLNVWNSLANQTDLLWRMGVLRRALADGSTEADAVDKARVALLDYGNLTPFERQYINRMVWFWTFQSRMASETLRNIVDNPTRVYRASLLSPNADISEVLGVLGVDGAAYDERVFPPEYMESRVFRAVIEDPATRQRWGLYGPSMPLPDSVMMIADFGAGLAGVAAGLGEATGATEGSGRTAAEVLREAQQSVASMAADRGSLAAKSVAALFGYESRRPDGGLSNYVDPRYVAGLRASGLWESFQSIVPVEVVDEPGRNMIRVRQGGERAWSLIRLLSLATGMDRNLRIYGPVAQAAAGVDPVTRQFQTTPTNSVLYSLGVTPGAVLDEEQARSQAAWDAYYELKDAGSRTP